nr:COP9 signalosome complex subunit 3-like [Lytechinus pictus]
MLSAPSQPLSQLYQEIANSYSTNNPSDVSSVLEKHSDQLNRDQNMGLGKQVVSSLYRKNIQRLTKTFLTLSLSDIARRVHLHTSQEAEQYVRNMIEDGEIHATISKQNGMVHFHDNPEKYDNPAVLRHVEQQMQHCISLDEKLKSMDQEIAVNPQYVQKSMGVREDDEVGGAKEIYSYIFFLFSYPNAASPYPPNPSGATQSHHYTNSTSVPMPYHQLGTPTTLLQPSAPPVNYTTLYPPEPPSQVGVVDPSSEVESIPPPPSYDDVITGNVS